MTRESNVNKLVSRNATRSYELFTIPYSFIKFVRISGNCTKILNFNKLFRSPIISGKLFFFW